MTRAAGVEHGRPEGPAEPGFGRAPAPPVRPRARSGRPTRAPAVTTSSSVPESAVHLLAAELHDGLSQHLFAAELDVHELRCMPGLPGEVLEVLERLAQRLEMGSKELRGALFKMLEAEREQDEHAAVQERMRECVAEFQDGHGCDTRVQIEGSGPEPEAAAARLLLRAVREGLANVAKHARASQVLVVLRRGRRWWTVEVHDDGAGDPDAVARCASEATSFGLFSLDAESARIGGRLWLSRAPGLGGVQLNVSVPVGAGPA